MCFGGIGAGLRHHWRGWVHRANARYARIITSPVCVCISNLAHTRRHCYCYCCIAAGATLAVRWRHLLPPPPPAVRPRVFSHHKPPPFSSSEWCVRCDVRSLRFFLAVYRYFLYVQLKKKESAEKSSGGCATAIGCGRTCRRWPLGENSSCMSKSAAPLASIICCEIRL